MAFFRFSLAAVLARLITLQAALDRIEELDRTEKIPEDVFNEFKNQIHRRKVR